MRSVLTFLCCLLAAASFAQPGQVIIANGGVFGSANFVTVAAYQPASQNYFVFDSIPASSVQDVVIDGNMAFVAADSLLVSYDIDNHSRLNIQDVKGIRKIAVHDSLIVVSRGYPVTSDFVQVYHRQNLNLLYSVPQVSDESEGVVIVDDTAFVAVPGNWMSTSGKLAVIDLANQAFKREMDFGTRGAGMGRLFTDGIRIFMICSVSFGSPYGFINSYGVSSGAFFSDSIALTVGGGAGLDENEMLYASFGSGIGSYNTYISMMGDTSIVAGDFVGSVLDTMQNRFYLTKTDYFSFGRAYIYDISGTMIDSFNVGISPEALAVDYRSMVGMEESLLTDEHIAVYPNPASDFVSISGLTPDADITVTDISGKEFFLPLHKQAGVAELDLKTLPSGMYFIRMQDESHMIIRKLIRE